MLFRMSRLDTQHVDHLRPMFLVVQVDLTRELPYGRHCERVEFPDVGGVDRYTHPTSLRVHRCLCRVGVGVDWREEQTSVKR